jgi:D-aminopeptidase
MTTATSHRSTPSGLPRARRYDISFEGLPGTNNAITDVPGVSVGYATLISGEGPLVVGQGPVRTGVTAILPRPKADLAVPVFAGLFSANGNGEMTGSHIIEEIGAFNFPVTITNTHSCGVARDGTIRWMGAQAPEALDATWGLPVAAETYDGFLNDINGHHLTVNHVAAAIDAAKDGAIEEGSVGGGTGMIAYEFKAGSGTASRIVSWQDKSFVVGSFVQANFGPRRNLTIRGRRVGAELAEPSMVEKTQRKEKGSIIAVVATDAPFLPHQLKRLARRIPLGVAWTGGLGYHSSGDIFLAFSTANPQAAEAAEGTLAQASYIPDCDINPFFDAVVHSIEEAILNALVANSDMTGRDGNFVPALPKDWLDESFGRAPAPAHEGAADAGSKT